MPSSLPELRGNLANESAREETSRSPRKSRGSEVKGQEGSEEQNSCSDQGIERIPGTRVDLVGSMGQFPWVCLDRVIDRHFIWACNKEEMTTRR